MCRWSAYLAKLLELQLELLVRRVLLLLLLELLLAWRRAVVGDARAGVAGVLVLLPSPTAHQLLCDPFETCDITATTFKQ